MTIAIPGFISLGLFLAWFICHSFVIWLAIRRNNAISISKWEGLDQEEFEKKMLFAQADLILEIWWFKALRGVFIYGSIFFFGSWLHYVSL
jgi:hypothetical protein